ncbi:transcriptional regulator [Spirosoma sp. RP8]|uniref:Transcriptional regulator n=1 Tax=Spirosoma liriopis TaxID=2937440 RepID=A0ABT0HLS6_9BACT|nr:transcriptional regulator [Spirosoma liriopis]MCK8493125.1 transcriptional regulator [Spirosoma liriopis]
MLRVIKTEREYEDALERVYELMQIDLAQDSPELDELEALALFVENYEARHYPIAPPHPIEAITFRLDQLGMPKSELSKILGGRNRQSEILSGKRKLSLDMIRKLHTTLHIPAESLIADY